MKSKARAVWALLRTQSSFRWKSACFVGVVLLLLLNAPRSDAQVGGFFGAFLDSWSGATASWASKLIGPGRGVYGIFYWCFALQVMLIGARWGIAVVEGKTTNFWSVLIRQFPVMMFLYGVLLLWPSYGGLLPVDFFVEIGKELSGYEQGIDSEELAGGAFGMVRLYTTLVVFKSLLFPNPLSIFYIIFLVVTVFAYFAVAVRTLFLTLEGNVLATIGPIPVALGAWSVTAGFADNYFRYCARFGLEYMLTMLMVSAGANLGRSWQAELADISNFRQDLIFVFVAKISVVAVVWMLLVVRLPSKMAAGLIHFWTPGIKEALGNG